MNLRTLEALHSRWFQVALEPFIVDHRIVGRWLIACAVVPEPFVVDRRLLLADFRRAWRTWQDHVDDTIMQEVQDEALGQQIQEWFGPDDPPSD